MNIEQFKELITKCYNEVVNDWNNQIVYLQEKQKDFKHKKDQVLYHFTKEDFEYIRYEKNLKTAYNVWIEQVFPHLLDNYKEKKLEEYRKSLGKIKVEEWWVKRDAYKEKLNKIKITKIKYRRFADLIKKINTGKLK